MKHITACFSSELIDICQKGFQTDKWQNIIHQFYGLPIAAHIFIASFKKGKLVLVCDCPLWASEARMKLPALRDHLRQEHQCGQLMFIEIKIDPNLFLTKKPQ